WFAGYDLPCKEEKDVERMRELRRQGKPFFHQPDFPKIDEYKDTAAKEVQRLIDNGKAISWGLDKPPGLSKAP
ncbi:unnamed protein product, partial [Amoebophrya sp. A25]